MAFELVTSTAYGVDAKYIRMDNIEISRSKSGEKSVDITLALYLDKNASDMGKLPLQLFASLSLSGGKFPSYLINVTELKAVDVDLIGKLYIDVKAALSDELDGAKDV